MKKRSTFSFDSNIFIDKAQFNQVLIKSDSSFFKKKILSKDFE